MTNRDITDAFHRLYYGDALHTWGNTRWMGVPALKCPLDLWVYQEILSEKRPDVVIECGTFAGGTALFLATVMDLSKTGRIISIDIEKGNPPAHPRITYLQGSTIDPAIHQSIHAHIQKNEKVMVLLDSDHTKNHVLAELKLYAPLVTNGQYLIVEDTNINGHPVLPEHGAGPMEAVEEFLQTTKDFARDATREKFLMTFNAGGYLLRHAGC